MADAPRRIGLPWYRREDYPRIRDMMADRHNLAPTYNAWLAAAQNNEDVGRQAGLRIARIIIEPDSFAKWCAERGVEPGSAARMDYVSERCAQESD
ncbi:hypothetical protein [Microvirga sp. VF16]|uniref:hypothetical protein n=1 Tax=Microvirga sp. VF16 TaxID=2807101 RepID=UPI00193DD2E1|nr:hypothetical protein [Microvirga sp. VF16]QRM30109.1 hypothetical protein JO965_03580 [Microvirga sp. VF16]